LQDESIIHEQLRNIIIVTLLLITLPHSSMAGVSYGGSLAITSDYLVRGISRNNHDVSPQADLHAAFSNGVDVGVFAASVQTGPSHLHNTEVSGFIGFAKDISDAWHTRTVINHYSYPWNRAGSRYDYDELNLDVAYEQWLTFSAMYSPHTPRYLLDRGVIGVTAKSLAISVQLPLTRQLSLGSGVGYAHLGGPYSDEYSYWAAGGTFSLNSVSISLQYVGTTPGARQLYYDAAARHRVAGTVIWRF
jgi:uncharacterized protein (TIGR02001 family)